MKHDSNVPIRKKTPQEARDEIKETLDQIDDESESSITAQAYFSAMDEAGDTWGTYASELLGKGVDRNTVEKICFDGYMTSAAYLTARYLA